MHTKPNQEAFASMSFLDEEMKRYEGEYPNKRTKAYYETLLRIRQAQDKGECPKEAYVALGTPRGLGSAEYGYYHANIHEYLFPSCPEFEHNDAYKARINKRIQFFLLNADPLKLMKRGWFPLNFPANYLAFLECFYGCYREESSKSLMDPLKDLSRLAMRHGNEIEKEIIKLIDPIVAECEAWDAIGKYPR